MWDRGILTIRVVWLRDLHSQRPYWISLSSGRPGDPQPLLIDVSDVDGSLVSSFAEDNMFSISGPFIALCSAHVNDLAHRAQTRTYCRSSYLNPADSPKLVISPPLLALGVCNSGRDSNY
ncbi:uncharacterized protein LOC103953283 [Pyrus x bretschneideri]|uniref:uncharacterized protein LOC103953283 n=1 Tax=Pyrus x bretschneideri TaxID=225117 RepID=UPI00202FD789|nr:uncharacterized protein LOC103953283 [Pyrus x bretschneideri]